MTLASEQVWAVRSQPSEQWTRTLIPSWTACTQHQLTVEIKSDAYCEALQYRRDLLPFTTREHTSLHIHNLHKITIMHAEKIIKSSVWKFVLYSSTIWQHREKLEHRCTLHNYIPSHNRGAPLSHIWMKSPKLFKKLQNLIPVAFQMVILTWGFWFYLYGFENYMWHQLMS